MKIQYNDVVVHITLHLGSVEGEGDTREEAENDLTDNIDSQVWDVIHNGDFDEGDSDYDYSYDEVIEKDVIVKVKFKTPFHGQSEWEGKVLWEDPSTPENTKYSMSPLAYNVNSTLNEAFREYGEDIDYNDYTWAFVKEADDGHDIDEDLIY